MKAVRLMADYQNLDVWHKAMSLVMDIYDASESFPPSERYGLANQIQRAAVSIPSNIAEGYGRQSDKELYYFLFISRGSLYEVETQLFIAYGRNYISRQQLQLLQKEINEVGRMLSGFIKHLEDEHPGMAKRRGTTCH